MILSKDPVTSKFIKLFPLFYIPLAYISVVIIELAYKTSVASVFKYEGYFLLSVAVMMFITKFFTVWSYNNRKERLADMARLAGLVIALGYIACIVLVLIISLILSSDIWGINENWQNALAALIVVIPVYLFSFANAVEKSHTTSYLIILLTFVFSLILILLDSSAFQQITRIIYFLLLWIMPLKISKGVLGRS